MRGTREQRLAGNAGDSARSLSTAESGSDGNVAAPFPAPPEPEGSLITGQATSRRGTRPGVHDPDGSGRPYRNGPRERTPPEGVLDLIERMFKSLNWSAAGQIALIMLALGVTAVLILGSLAGIAYFLAGTSPWLSAAGSTAAGGAVSTGAHSYVRRRQRKSQS